MKFHLKKLTALLLAVMLMLTLTGIGEEDIVLEEGAPIEDILSLDLPDPGEDSLDAELDDLDLAIPDMELQAPDIEAEAISEAQIEAEDEDETVSNALVTSIKIGVKEKYIINTKSLKGKLTFASSKKAVATVTKRGVVMGKKAGTAKITITAAKGKKYTITVTVLKAPTKVTMSQKTASMEIGDTLQLKAKLPKKTASKKMVWASSNKSVATVTQNGKVTAKNPGTATISVRTFNGKKATCKVTVNAPEPEPTPEPTPVTPVLSADQTYLDIDAGESYNVRITYLNNNTIAWTTSDSSIVTCNWVSGWDGDTCQLTITGLSAGSATVTVYDETTQDYVDIYVTVYGYVEKVSELSKLLFKTIPEANAMLDLQLTYYKDNMYTADYFSVLVDSSGVINTVGFFNNYGSYTLMGQWPGRSLSNAARSLFDLGFQLESDKDQLGTFTHPDLPGCVLLLKYANSKVDYIIFSTSYGNAANFL